MVQYEIKPIEKCLNCEKLNLCIKHDGRLKTDDNPFGAGNITAQMTSNTCKKLLLSND